MPRTFRLVVSIPAGLLRLGNHSTDGTAWNGQVMLAEAKAVVS